MNSAETEPPVWPFYTDPLRLDVRGLDVAYRREGGGEPLLHLHGAVLTRRWLPFYEELSRRVDLIAPEHPGFGDTPLPEWLDGFDDLVIHYADLLDGLGLETVHLSGHSLGAWIAAEIAVYLPERLRSLTLVCPIGLEAANLVDPFRQEPEELQELLLNGQTQWYGEYIDDGDPTEALVQRYSESIAHARLAWNPRHDRKLERRLERVRCPTLVVVPDEDRYASIEQMRRYGDLIPNARIETIHGQARPTGHLPMIQEPVRLAEAITDFILAPTSGST